MVIFVLSRESLSLGSFPMEGCSFVEKFGKDKGIKFRFNELDFGRFKLKIFISWKYFTFAVHFCQEIVYSSFDRDLIELNPSYALFLPLYQISKRNSSST